MSDPEGLTPSGILVLSHVDTVHPVGTLAGPLPFRRDGDRFYGPGVFDMKGGLTLAVAAQGAHVGTIEGLARGGALHPLQAAFIAHDGLQCGYCTPGQIMSAAAMLAEGHADTDDEVREQMSGNLCRCGAYPNIVAAIQAARREA